MRLPVIHLNGSGAERLYTGARAALEALWKAHDAMRDIAPHARDYYPAGDEAFFEARDEHEQRLARLQEVERELEALVEHLMGSVPS